MVNFIQQYTKIYLNVKGRCNVSAFEWVGYKKVWLLNKIISSHTFKIDIIK